MSDDVKVSVTLPKEVVDTIKQLAAENGMTYANAIVESVRLNGLLTLQERKKAVIILERPDGTMERVVRHRLDPRS